MNLLDHWTAEVGGGPRGGPTHPVGSLLGRPEKVGPRGRGVVGPAEPFVPAETLGHAGTVNHLQPTQSVESQVGQTVGHHVDAASELHSPAS